ncbi:MAG: hypothetical protein V4630_16140 [Pseudomonadota bacterium]
MSNTSDHQPGPTNEKLRRPAPNVIDQRQQQIDPAGKHREDPDARPDENRKQPGGSIHDGKRIEKDTQV